VKLPRDLSGSELAQRLRGFGYRSRGRPEATCANHSERGEHHLTIPNHAVLRVGTLAFILGEVAEHFQVERAEVIRRLLG
jgi:hypothetical protein